MKFNVILSVICLLLISCGKGFVKLKNPINIKDDYGKTRNYKLYIDTKLEDRPLFVYFHGVISKDFKTITALKSYTGSPVEETGLIEFCKKKKIALLVPEPSYEFRFLGKKAKGWSPFVKESNGIEKMIDGVVKKYCINRKKIFLLGISAGAVFSHFLANKRPSKYTAILSHSQGYTDESGKLLIPLKRNAKKFGVLFVYTKGDYENLKAICEKSYLNYKTKGYKTIILRNLPVMSHKWVNSYNSKFYLYLLKLTH